MVVRPHPDVPDVQLLSNNQINQAMQATVASTGFTLEELKVQAASGSFANERARLTWTVVESLQDRQ